MGKGLEAAGLAGASVPLPPSAAAYQFVTASGDDANNGLSLGAGKATIDGAIAALPAAGGRVVLAAGTFAPAALNKANVVVEGAWFSSVIQSAGSGSTAPVTVSAANVELSDLTVKPTGTFSGSLVSVSAADVCVDRVLFDGSAATTNYGSCVIGASGADRLRVRDCTMKLNNGGTARGWTAVEITDGADTEVRGNVITGGRARGVDIRSTTGAATGARVVNNRISGQTLQGIVAWNSYAQVLGNRVASTGDYGIFLTGDPASGSANYGSAVVGNVVTACGGGIDCEYDVHGFAITGNTVKGSTGNGISLINSITDGTIEGNTVDSAGAYGITCALFGGSPTSSRLNITGNVVRSAATYGIRLDDGANSHIGPNVITGCTHGVYVDKTNAAGTSIVEAGVSGNTTADFVGVVPTVPAAFHPLDIAGCATWLDASAIAGIADGAKVPTWFDLSGNSRDAANGTAGTQPLYRTGQVNGRPVVRFLAATNQILAQAAIGSPIAQPFTLFIVTNDYSTGAATDGPVDGTNRIVFTRSSTTQFGALALVSGTDGTLATDPVIGTLVANGAASYLRANGAQGATATATAVAFGGLTLGNNYFSGAAMTGDICEVLVYSGALSATDIGRVERYLARKYRITLP